MKCVLAIVLLALAASTAAEATNPLGQTIALLDDLAAKLTAEASAAEKAAAEYATWCNDKITDTGFAIKTGETEKADLEALITKMTANVEAESSEIEELAASIAQDDADLKAATGIRAEEEKTYKASEAELLDSIETLSRALTIIERESSKNPAALVQVDTKNVQNMIKSLKAVIDAASFSSGDQKKLLGLVQAQQESDAEDDEPGAPAAAVYESHSKSILDVLEDLKEKAEAELAELRKAEVSAKHSFELTKQSLTDSMEADNKRLSDGKKASASYAQQKAAAEGDLKETVETLGEDKTTLASTEAKCKEVAATHVASMEGRKEELAVIAEAKKILSDTTSGAVTQTYSFFQGSSQFQSHALLASVEIVNLVKKLAKQHHSAALAQLASRIATVFKYGAQAGEDPFAKVKALISDLIAKLESEASAESSEKAFCDEELAKTAAKKEELDSALESLTSKIETASSKSAELKGEVKALQADLAKMAASQAEATKIRQETHEDYVKAKADLELGLSGVRKAISVLRDFYGGAAALMQQPEEPASYAKSSGTGKSILDILEVVADDFAKNLATEEAEESAAAASYEEETQQFKITKVTKEQDVKYKTKEATGLDKSVAELSADKDTTSTELSSVLEYDAKLKERCIAKPETYESRKERREAEIAGLKQALQILETETALVQRSKRGHKGIFLGAL